MLPLQEAPVALGHCSEGQGWGTARARRGGGLLPYEQQIGGAWAQTGRGGRITGSLGLKTMAASLKSHFL